MDVGLFLDGFKLPNTYQGTLGKKGRCSQFYQKLVTY